MMKSACANLLSLPHPLTSPNDSHAACLADKVFHHLKVADVRALNTEVLQL
jgi:hypothetical protein